MTDAFRSTASSKNADAAGADLAVQMQRFIASDVIWEDLFKEPTKEELEKIGVTGVNVPDSVFLRNPDIATSASMKAVWQRVHGAATGGATCSPRGTQLVSTTVLPAGKELSTERHEHDPAEHRPRVPGQGQELGLRTGGGPEGHAHDPAEPEADQVPEVDPADRLRAPRRPSNSGTSACRRSTRRRRSRSRSIRFRARPPPTTTPRRTRFSSRLSAGSRPSPSRPPAAPRVTARRWAVRGRAPSRRSGRSRGPGSR